MGILGSLKSSGKKEEADSGEDVPDELPPLAEEALNKQEGREAPAQKKKETPAPDSLPPLNEPSDDVDEEKEKKEEQAKAPETEEPPDASHVSRDAGKAEEKEQSEKEEKEEEKETKQPEKEKEGFFSSVKKSPLKITQSEDLLGEMKEYWQERGIDVTEIKTLTEAKILSELKELFERLSSQESSWREYLKEMEKYRQLMKNTEVEIALSSSRIKKLKRELDEIRSLKEKLFKEQEVAHAPKSEISPDRFFHLKDGRQLKDIPELMNALKEMDDSLFNYYVNGEKNDFASWIEGVFNNHELAELLRRVKSRDDMLAVLEMFLNKNEE